jgi:hypothetical protein
MTTPDLDALAAEAMATRQLADRQVEAMGGNPARPDGATPSWGYVPAEPGTPAAERFAALDQWAHEAYGTYLDAWAEAHPPPPEAEPEPAEVVTYVTEIGYPPAGNGVLHSLHRPMPEPEPLPEPEPELELEP